MSDVTHDDTTVTAWATGGAVGTMPGLTCQIHTAAGREDDRTLHLSIQER